VQYGARIAAIVVYLLHAQFLPAGETLPAWLKTAP
jgi:hypothetical protein